MTDYVLTGMTKRRAELAAEIEALHEQLSKALADLENLDRTIVQFDPDFQVEAIRPKAFRPPADWSHRGKMSRVVLSILRQAAEPMTTRDLALELLVTRALDKSDLKLLRLDVEAGWGCIKGRSGTAGRFGLRRGRGSLCFGR